MRVLSRRMMICIKTRHFRFNRLLLLSIGLWPYERTKLVQLHVTLFFGILITAIAYQLLALVSAECTPALYINVLSIVSIFIILAIIYNSFWINVHTVRWLLDELQCICNELKDENEIAIITKYGNIAKRYTTAVMLFHVCNVITFLSLTLLLRFFDSVMFVNKSQSLMQKIVPKFFIGRESYMYLIFPFFIGASCIGGTAIVAIGMMIVAYLKHGCGMFRIASYRIEQAMMTINMLENISLENEIIIYTKIIYAVDIHRKAIKFCTLLLSSFEGSLFLMIVISVICLSFNLYRISEIVSFENDIEQFYIHFMIIIAMFAFLFVANYAGQEITDYNNHVFSTAYNVRWYTAPLHIQRLILFLLQNGSKTFRPSLSGMFALSIEFFATLTKASLSYFTVVHSTQRRENVSDSVL